MIKITAVLATAAVKEVPPSGARSAIVKVIGPLPATGTPGTTRVVVKVLRLTVRPWLPRLSRTQGSGARTRR